MSWLKPSKIAAPQGVITPKGLYDSGRVVQASHGSPSKMDFLPKGIIPGAGEKFFHGSRYGQ